MCTIGFRSISILSLTCRGRDTSRIRLKLRQDQVELLVGDWGRACKNSIIYPKLAATISPLFLVKSLVLCGSLSKSHSIWRSGILDFQSLLKQVIFLLF